jgi:ER lumen protein retaining receptor
MMDGSFVIHSSYNTTMKLIFISTACMIIWYMRFHKVVSQTYDKEQDTFRYVFLIGPSLTLALLLNHEFTVTEVSKKIMIDASTYFVYQRWFGICSLRTPL